MKRRKQTGAMVVSKLKEILRLKERGLNQSEIARGANVARSTVQDYLRRASALGTSAAELLELSEEELEVRLGKMRRTSKRKPEPDYRYLARELSRKGVTLALLWQEYIEQTPNGCSYARFCQCFREWKKQSRISMRQIHKAGEKVFVDYAGQTVPIYKRGTNEVLYQAQIFIGVLGASNYTFAEATPSQEAKHWLGSHRRCFEYFGGVPRAVVPDNLKSGVKSALYYEPELNPAYQNLAEHYGVAVLPARIRKPKDKPKVEVGVQIVERWILAVLRNRKSFSISELNQEISRLLEKINHKQMKSYGCSRNELFEAVDKPALQALPQTPYEHYEIKIARVNIDYHVEVEQHYYSVPYKLIRQEVEIRIKEQTIAVFFKGKRIAQHLRSKEKFHHTTKKEHMPLAHQAMREWTPRRLIDWAGKIGPQTRLQVEALLNARVHPEQSYRACLGVLRLGKKLGAKRLEAACKRANQLGVVSFRRVKSILDSGMDRLPLIEQTDVSVLPHPSHGRHANIRGGGYYR